MLFSPLSTSSALTSRTTTRQPACAQTWAMPEPISPQPATPTFSIGMRIPLRTRTAAAGQERTSLSDLKKVFTAWLRRAWRCLVPFQLIGASLAETAGLPLRMESSSRYSAQMVGTALAFDDFGGDDGIAAFFAGLIQTGFRAVHQVGDNVFIVKVGPGNGLGDSRAHRKRRAIPGRTDTGGGFAQFFREVSRPGKSRVRKDKGQRPRRVLHGDIVLTHHRLQRLGKLLHVPLYLRLALLVHQVVAVIDLKNGQS